MLSINNDVFTLADLQRLPEDQVFSDRSRQFLAGRCLLDAVEYLRIDPKHPATFRQLVNAHAMRVLLQCVAALEREDLKRRFKPQIEPTCVQLLQSRKQQPPYFGDDFWDWAYTIEALLVVKDVYPEVYDHKAFLTREVRSYYDSVADKLSSKLSFNGEAEWLGPATAVAAYRILVLCKTYLSPAQKLSTILMRLKQLALKRIVHGKFLSRTVVPEYFNWHYGQVVSEFTAESAYQQLQLKNLTPLAAINDRTQRAYALARVIQGTFKCGDSKTTNKAVKMVYECERPERPFGTGIVGETVKGSLNVLEAVWPMLNREERNDVGTMLDRLFESYKSANTIGFVVAVQRELEACKREFLAADCKITELEPGAVEVNHEKYRVLITQGKALADAQEATKKVVIEYKAKWLVMVGIAGSLGDREAQDKKLSRPEMGDVVIATSIAPYEIRDKVRSGEVQNVPVPFRGLEWDIIPTHPGLFAIALRAAQKLLTEKNFTVHAGLIETGTGIKDDLVAREDILKEYPGGLAAEEESYIFGLISLLYGRPHLVLRGISDYVGHKIDQQRRGPGDEEAAQRNAASNAAKLAVKVVALLSDGWAAGWAVK